MDSLAPLDRCPLRDRIYGLLRERIVRGEFGAGEPLRDGPIAESLGASRTPVREALIRLTSEGFLENHVGRGFRVRPLLRRELEELFPLIWTLEPLALKCSVALQPEQEAELEGLGAALSDEQMGAAERHALDADWHRSVISGCPNERLLRYIEELRGALQRYETAYLKPVVGMELSVPEHREIATAFGEGDRERACSLLHEHWRRGMGELIAMLPEEGES